MIVPPFDGPIIFLIDRTVAWWLGPRATQTVLYRITLKIKFHFFLQFCAKFLSKLFQIIFNFKKKIQFFITVET